MLLLVPMALAQEVNVEYDYDSVPDEYEGELASIETEAEEGLAGQMKLDGMDEFLSQMADANVLSAKGLGVDYATNMQRFAIGGGFGSAVNEGGFRFVAGEEPLPDTGFAFQISAMGGLNLGVLSKKESVLRRVKLFVNGMKASTARDPFTGTFVNYGGHLQIKLIGGVADKGGVSPVEWGGIDVTSGYEYSSYTLQLEEDYPVDASDLRWDAAGTFLLTSETASVPIEVSTNLRVLVVSVFAGGAVDINLNGRADSEIEVSGPITYTYEGQEMDVGSADASLAGSGLASEYTPRIFAGAQINILMVKLYGQLNVTLDQSVGGHLGVRVVM